ncbi:metallophosphoesterase [Chloroflexus sp.]|uniref:metallophosphoesterase n=1 Tax=Chloroflexus sp. TaxID=1904827 RepID=UPI002ADE4329|nr:metallophosphoesterase [Chloroflexus sp.]
MIWTISDLHLSFARPKPMDIFGPGWKDHPERIAQAWRERVTATDWVLIAGDISWAMKLPDALLDLQWIDALPGTKVLIRGNHDYWCPRRVNSIRRHLPPSLRLIGADALDIGEAVLCGTRGWITPETPGFTETDLPIYQRELGLLERALAAGQTLAVNKPLIVMIHFPPFVNRQPTEFSRRIAASGAAACIYGHLHRRYDWDNAVQGRVDGVYYQLTACDYLGFGPVAVRGLNGWSGG